MEPYTAAQTEVEEARKRVAIYYASHYYRQSASSHPNVAERMRNVVVYDPVSRVNGTYTVEVRLELYFKRATDVNDSAPGCKVLAGWTVVFPSSYPTAPCTWHYVKDAYLRDGEYRGTGSVSGCCGLQSFVVEDVVSSTSSGIGEQGVERAGGPLFLLGFSFLCNWWFALELDEGSLAHECNRTYLGSTPTLEEESGGWPLRDDCMVHFEDFMSGSMMGRPRRQFAAVFMPNGGILSWDLSDLSKGKTFNDLVPHAASPAGDPLSGAMTSGADVGATPSFDAKYGNEEDIGTDSTASRATAGDLCRRIGEKMHRSRISVVTSSIEMYTVHGITCKGKRVPLPSLLAPETILYTAKYTMDCVCLYDDKPHGALLRNARITRDAKALRQVSSTFRMLSHIVHGVLGSQTPLLCARRLLLPALSQSVEAMQAKRQTFWAGVAVCCVLLPSILCDELGLADLSKHLIRPVDCYRCVSVVSHVFSTIDAPIKLREVDLVIGAIEDTCRTAVVNQQLQLAGRVKQAVDHTGKTDGNHSPAGVRGPPSGTRLSTVTECAVCGLAIPQRGHEARGAGAGGFVASPSSRKRNGCLILHCIYCGHGGHLAHIMAWWNDQSVRCCPKGCNCTCVY